MTTVIPALRVLYVEDNAVDLDLARRELARQAPKIVFETAPTIAAALELLMSALPLFDVVLTDLSLPDGSGLELLNHIRQRELPLAVVIITGSGDQDAAVAALKAGADDFLVKRTGYLGNLSIVLTAAYNGFQGRNRCRSRPLKVLYAEVNVVDIDLTRRYFTRHSPHISLEVVHNGIEVLSRLPAQDVDAESYYDALLLDYRLPGMNALEVVKELRQMRGIDIPIVLVTGQGSEDIAVVALRLGVDEYVVKYDGYHKQLPHIVEKLEKQSELNKSEKRYRSLSQLLGQREQEMKDLNQILESRIAERTSQLSLATDSAQIGVWDYLVAENKLSWNKWMYVLYGIREEDFSGAYEAWCAGLHPDDLARCDAELQMALRGEKVFDTEFRVVWPSDEIRHIKGAALVLQDANGVAQRMIGVNYDVTSVKRAEAKLSALNEKLSMQVDVADAANLAKSSFVANMSHELRTPMNAILGLTYLLQKASLPYHEKELVQKIRVAGQSLLSIVNDVLDFSKIEAGHLEIEQVPFLLRDVIDNLGTLMASAVGTKQIELIITPPMDCALRLRGDALRLGQILVNLVGNAIKFTEQGHVDAAITTIAETEQSVTLNFSVSDTGIGKYSNKQEAQTMYTPKILIADDLAEIHYLMELHLTEYGKTVNQIPVFLHAEDGQTALDLLTMNPDTDVVVLDLSMPVMNGFEFLIQIQNDLRLRRIPVCVFSSNKNDSAKSLALGARDYVYKPGDYDEIVLRVFNLIGTKRLAEASDQSKSAFLSIVSHELRTPMNGVIGGVQLLQMSDQSEETTTYIEIIKTSAQRMMGMINSILDYLHSETPLHHLPVMAFPLRATVQETIESLSSAVAGNNVTLVVTISADLPDNLVGLADKLQLILHHLLSNAVKFSPSGKVTIQIEPGRKDPVSVQLLCSIIDTGIGIPMDAESRIFDPLTQADESLTRSFGGLGLGLSIASRIVQMMGGSIQAERNPGGGSTFRFAVTCGIDQNPA
jgi:signal transduction histidine kinase/AmiR/NasT family two-component response regulator